MIMINEKVEHITFGIGNITEVNEHMIKVKFIEPVGEKIFLFPDAFENYLKVINPVLGTNVQELLRKKKEQIELELERKRKEREAEELGKRRAKLESTRKKSSTRQKKTASR